MEKRLSTKRIFEGKLLSLRVDEVEVSKNGRHATREVVEHGDAVAILPIDEDGKILLVLQFRYAPNAELIEIPAGLIEKGEDPAVAAQRELREETGYSASRWTSMPAIWSSPGFSDEKLYVYLAEGLEKSPLNQDEDEDISLLRLSPDEARALLNSKDSQDAKTLMAIAWYFSRTK